MHRTQKRKTQTDDGKEIVMDKTTGRVGHNKKRRQQNKTKSEIGTVKQEVGLKGANVRLKAASFCWHVLFPQPPSPLLYPSPPKGGARAPPPLGCAGFTGSIVKLVLSITCCPLALHNSSTRWLKSTKVD